MGKLPMVMIGQPTETLLVSANISKLSASLKPEAYHVRAVDDPGKAMETLRDGEFDLIMLDDALFSDSDIQSIVREIKRRYPLVPVLVFSENTDIAYQTDLMEAGADDLLHYNLYGEEFHRRMRLVQQQRRQNRTLARRNQNLHAIASLSRKMHSATDPQTLIRETIDLACNTFKLYGIAIVLQEGDELRLYAGREGVATDGRLYEGTMQMHEYDPFRRVIAAGNKVQVFRSIRSDSYYTPIPTLENAESVIIVPLNYQDYTLGAIGVFGTDHDPLTHNDLPIYELFAAQFTTALQNARHYLTQAINVRFSKHLLRAWQRFSALNTFAEIATALRELIEDVPGVGEALVWLYPDLTHPLPQFIIDTRHSKIAHILTELQERGHVDELIEQMGDSPQLTLRLGRGQKDPMGPLFREMRVQQLMLFPITDSARLIGGVIAGAGGSRQFSIEDADLMKSLAHAAGQALERTTLTASMTEKSGRLEAILRSITEGIFFVDADGKVAFCNPQFTELTSINPSEVLNHDPEMLLETLAQQSDDADRVLRQLKEAITNVLDVEHEAEDYPIVEITLTDPERDIHVEFVKLSGLNDTEVSWTGIVRNNSRFKSMFSSQMLLLDMMSERVRVPYAQVRGMITTLIEQHGRFTNRERSRFLRQIEKAVENLGDLWDNFLEMYNLEVSGMALNREETDLYDLVQRVLDSRTFSEARRRIRVEAPAKLPLVRVDELRIEKAVVNVVQNALNYSPKSAPVNLRMESLGNEVRIIVQDQGEGMPADQLDQIFEPFYQSDDEEVEENNGLGLYVSRELIRRHGGHIWAESAPGKGTTVTIALPSASTEAIPIPRVPIIAPDFSEPVTPRRDRGEGYSVPARQPKTIMSVEGRSRLIEFLRDRLETQGYELLVYDAGEEALRDINAIRIDLILLDVNLKDSNSLDICERIRKRTPVPIIMIADEPSEAEKVRSFELGADEYIARPMSNDEGMARVNGILKRRTRVEEVTLEPLDLGELYVDFARREVFLNNKPLELTRIEYDLLHTLAINEGHVLTHKQLLEKVWGPEYQGETQYLWVNVSRLRKKLEPTPDSPRYIHTQQGVGYEFRRP